MKVFKMESKSQPKQIWTTYLEECLDCGLVCFRKRFSKPENITKEVDTCKGNIQQEKNCGSAVLYVAKNKQSTNETGKNQSF